MRSIRLTSIYNSVLSRFSLGSIEPKEKPKRLTRQDILKINKEYILKGTRKEQARTAYIVDKLLTKASRGEFRTTGTHKITILLILPYFYLGGRYSETAKRVSAEIIEHGYGVEHVTWDVPFISFWELKIVDVYEALDDAFKRSES